MEEARAPLLPSSNSRQLVIEPQGGEESWIRVDGKWYPATARTLRDKQLALVAVMVPCLGVALKCGLRTRKTLIAMALTTLLYFPGVFFALFTILIEPRRPSREQMESAPFGYVFGTDIPAGDVLNYAALD